MDRIRIFKIIILAAAVAIVFRLFYWQFIAKIEGGSEPNASDNLLPAKRGEIFTSDGFPLAANQEASLLYAVPYEMEKSPDYVAKILAPYLISEKYATQEANLSDEEENQKEEEIQRQEKYLAQKLKNQNLLWVQLARKVHEDTRIKIQENQLTGLGFEKDDKRFYPESSMAAQLLGFVGSDKFGNDTGYFGLEGYYNRILKGKPGKSIGSFDPLGFL